MCFAFYFIAENDFFSCLGFVFMQSFRLYHLFPFASRWEWMKCGIFCLCFLLGIFVCDFCLEAVSLGAICLLWFFPLTFLLSRPRYGFSRLFSYFHAQFPLPEILISFRGGLFCLLFTFHAHAMGFPACFSAPTPSFFSATYRLASGVGFSACFSSPTPTPWVSPLIFLLSRPVSAPRHID